MKKQKISLADIKGKLSRTEMRSIMAGTGGCDSSCTCAPCTFKNGDTGSCRSGGGNCYCATGTCP